LPGARPRGTWARGIVHRLVREHSPPEHPRDRLQHPLSDFALGAGRAVEHLASHLLGRITRELSAAWNQVYGHPVYFAETFIDPARFRGTCYRAANWIELGQTQGRGKDDLTHRPNRTVKTMLGLPLCRDFRERLLQRA